MKTRISLIKNTNLTLNNIEKVPSGKNQSRNDINKPDLNDEMYEFCRMNLVNYYVCYGSAVVSVRNAERKLIENINYYIYESF